MTNQKMARSILVLWSMLILQTGYSSSQPVATDLPDVQVNGFGNIKGILKPGFQGGNFEAFLGIPYALPPVGNLRFSNPVPYPSFSSTLNATTEKLDCLQKNYLLSPPQVSGVEDCLYMNIYRPTGLLKGQKLPVMVYIYGGGFFFGSASQYMVGPEYFMDTREVILVTFNYRLGPFGFLSTNDSNMSGNWGLKDQRLALRWIQQHIGDFGGNKKAVTIFGQSAGAASVHMQMLSTSSQGLFRNAIALSATANAPFAFHDNPLPQARKVGQLCNIAGAQDLTTAELTSALRRVDAMTLLDAGDALKYWHINPLTNYRPVMESASEPDAFLTQDPNEQLKSGNYNAVPWMASIVPQEGAVAALSILQNDTLVAQFNNQFDYFLEKLIEWPENRFTPEQLRAKTALVASEYFGDERKLTLANSQSFLDVITERGFYHPLYTTIRHYLNRTDVDVNPFYLFKFNYQGQFSFSPVFGGGMPKRDYGVVHCDDLLYLFRTAIFFPIAKDSADAQVIKASVDHLIYFAKHSKIQNHEQLNACTKQTFLSGVDSICDYREIVKVTNGAKPFEFRTNNKFNVRRMRFWDGLLEY